MRTGARAYDCASITPRRVGQVVVLCLRWPLRRHHAQARGAGRRAIATASAFGVITPRRVGQAVSATLRQVTLVPSRPGVWGR